MDMQPSELAPIKQEVEEYLYNNQEIVINSSDKYTHAADIVKQISIKIKKVEEKRMEYTKPLDESKKRIMADFKAITEPLEKFVDDVKVKMLDWARAEQKKADEEQKRIEAEAIKQAKENKQAEVTVPIVNEAVKTQRGAVTTTTVKKVWKWKIIDETKVPREYLCIEAPKVVEAIRDGVRKIEGLEIYQEEQLSIR